MFNNFEVTKVTDLLSSAQATDGLSPVSIPDHSILSCCLLIHSGSYTDTVSQENSINTSDGSSSFVKFDVKNIPNSFLMTDAIIQDIHATVYRLETMSG